MIEPRRAIALPLLAADDVKAYKASENRVVPRWKASQAPATRERQKREDDQNGAGDTLSGITLAASYDERPFGLTFRLAATPGRLPAPNG